VKLFLIIALIAVVLALIAAATQRSGPRVTTITRDRDLKKDDDHA